VHVNILVFYNQACRELPREVVQHALHRAPLTVFLAATIFPD